MEQYRDIEVYDLQSYYLITGKTKNSQEFKLLKIKKLSFDLEIQEVKQTFDRPQLEMYLKQCFKSGSPEIVIKADALMGVVKFTQGFYLYLVTKRIKVGKIRGQSLYKIQSTRLFKIFTENQSKDEKKYLDIFNSLDIELGFYFSYHYDLTSTLQENVIKLVSTKEEKYKEKRHKTFHAFKNIEEPSKFEHKEIYPWKTQFVWNHEMVVGLYPKLIDKNWLVSVIHGFVGYRYISILSRKYDMVVISRRSRFFAGTRYLKRGLNEEGQVANDVETEQILIDKLPFGKMSAFVQHRGSVPLFWCQDHNSMLPSPPIILNQNDFMHDATILHFSDMFSRYGSPIILINLLRVNMKNKENSLAQEYLNTVEHINSQLPEDFQIIYNSFDIKNEIKKSKKMYEEKFYVSFKELIPKIGVFVTHSDEKVKMKFQIGVVRTNCVDCIDRTNEGQLLISHLALEVQLAELGICKSLSKKCEIVHVLTKLFEEMGDAIALQYSGSIAHKATNSSEKSKQSKLLVATKRHLANLIKDSKKQQAINLYLGMYKADLYPIPLWDIPDDFRLHNRKIVYSRNRGKWWKYEVKKYYKRLGIKLEASPKTPNRQKLNENKSRVKVFAHDKNLLMTHNSNKFSSLDKKSAASLSDLIEVNFQEDGLYGVEDLVQDVLGGSRAELNGKFEIVAKEDIELFKAYVKMEEIQGFNEFYGLEEDEIISTALGEIKGEQFIKYLDLSINPSEFLRQVENEDEIFSCF